MLRLLRLSLNDIEEQFKDILPLVNDFIASLAIDNNYKNIFAAIEIDSNTNEVLFNTYLTGGIINVNEHNKAQYLAQNLHFIEAKEQFLNALTPLMQDNQIAKFLALILNNPQYVLLVDNKDIVIAPFITREYYQNLLASTPSPPLASSKTNFMWVILLILLLLLLLGAIYYWWYNNHHNELSKLNELNAHLEQLYAQDQVLSELKAQVDHKIDAYYANNAQDKLNKLNQELVIYQKQNQALDALLALVDKKMLKAQAQKLNATNNNQNTSSLPKCKTIIANNEVPQLSLVVDGSGSMLNLLNDGELRIFAAHKAAKEVVNILDPNVKVHLIGMQGCPFARDYGVFAANNHQALNSAFSNINPMLSLKPTAVLTPLVSAMRLMANTSPKNVDSVGVIISDGVDTCDGTEDLNICDVAREIHSLRPKLKINVVLIGDDAPDAKCVADITGGKVFKPQDAKSIVRDLKAATQKLTKVCTP